MTRPPAVRRSTGRRSTVPGPGRAERRAGARSGGALPKGLEVEPDHPGRAGGQVPRPGLGRAHRDPAGRGDRGGGQAGRRRNVATACCRCWCGGTPMDEAAEALVGFTDGFVRFDALPPSAVHAARRVLVDSVGCAVAAAREPTIVGLSSSRKSSPGAAACSAPTCGPPGYMAAFVNGAMAAVEGLQRRLLRRLGDLGPHPSDNLAGSWPRPNWPGRTAAASSRADRCLRGGLSADRPGAAARPQAHLGLHRLPRRRDRAGGREAVRALPRSALRCAEPGRRADLALNQTRNGELSQWKGLRRPVRQPGWPVRRAAGPGRYRRAAGAVRRPGRAGRPPW